MERLVLVRTIATRIAHASECHRQVYGSNNFTDEVDEAMPVLLGEKPGAMKRRKKVAAALLASIPDVSAMKECQKMFIGEIASQLSQLNEALTSSDDETVARLRRANSDVPQLDTLLDHFIGSFNSMHERCIPALLAEMEREGLRFAAPLADTEDNKMLVSVYPIDFMVGLKPCRSPNVMLLHFVQLLQTVETRAKAAKVRGVDPVQLQKIEDLEQLCLQMRDMVSAQTAVVKKAEAAALEAAINLVAKKDVQRKRSMETRLVEATLLEEREKLEKAAEMFLTPQYHRRNQLTYQQPARCRLAVKIFDGNTQTFKVLKHSYSGKAKDGSDIDPDLVPFEYQFWVSFQDFPEMVKAARCAIRNYTKEDHMRVKEETREVGGYFIMNGGERVLRCVMVQRGNMPINVQRPSFADKGQGFSDKAVIVRSKRPSGLSAANFFYYANGEVFFSFARRVVWHIPVCLLLFALRETSAIGVFNALTAGLAGEDDHVRLPIFHRAEALIQHHSRRPYAKLNGRHQFLAVLGAKFRAYQEASSISFLPDASKTTFAHSDAWYGMYMLRRHVLPHLNSDAWLTDNESCLDGPSLLEECDAKFDAITQIIRQLHMFVNDEHKVFAHGVDSLSMQETLTPAQLLICCLESCFIRNFQVHSRAFARSLKAEFVRKLLGADDADTLRILHRHILQVSPEKDKLRPIHHLLTTGNFAATPEGDFLLPQSVGWVLMAERLNFFRFFEQLRSIHRGKQIADMRSSEVRKYRPDAFGFVCMVHSPDGVDCGVQNQMSISVQVSPAAAREEELLQLIQEEVRKYLVAPIVDCYLSLFPIWIEGRFVGYAEQEACASMGNRLRELKRNDLRYKFVEVVHIEDTSKTPGLYIFAGAGRLMRTITHIGTGKPMLTGTWEQSWLDIAAVPADIKEAVELGKSFSHIETHTYYILSLTSLTIPFFEHNCSPRNLFQCGLSKQTAGTQIQSLAWRKDAKLFRVVTPQRYIVRTLTMDDLDLDEFSLGANALVAVAAYTGYDMDDAVIINKNSVERGLFHAMITVSKVVDLRANGDDQRVFHNMRNGKLVYAELREDGLPNKRRQQLQKDSVRDHSYPALEDASAVYSTAIKTRVGESSYEYEQHNVATWRKFDKGEQAWVHNVIPLRYDGSDVTAAVIVFRIRRNPQIGDKLASRGGQKGTIPLLVPQEDMPFTREGHIPDIIINPHAFPSRMTVGMLLELMVGKLGALQGRFVDWSAWRLVGDDPRGAEHAGHLLAGLGYQRHGRETMYCGFTGENMEADIYMGIGGYQRLRHMVSDKWQARARTDVRHPVVSRTGQPVKGRKRHGGVRVGEMERDGLLSHGVSSTIVDRLMHVSDGTKAFLCTRCGGFVGIYERQAAQFTTSKACNFCEGHAAITAGAGASQPARGGMKDDVIMIDIPQVLKVFIMELASIGIRVTLKTSPA